jgi:DNA-binding NarL/FixJ family response regulator
MSPKCIRVGIADDDEFVRVLLTGALGKSAQVQVVAAVENGEEAVELASSGQIDVLLLDVEMPRMSGAKALPIIRSIAPAVKVVMHSSHCSGKNSPSFLAAGAAACVAKPSSVARVLEVICATAIAEAANHHDNDDDGDGDGDGH